MPKVSGAWAGASSDLARLSNRDRGTLMGSILDGMVRIVRVPRLATDASPGHYLRRTSAPTPHRARKTDFITVGTPRRLSGYQISTASSPAGVRIRVIGAISGAPAPFSRYSGPT